MDYPAADLARRALLSLMDDCSVLAHTLLQWMSRCDIRTHIDREIGDLKDDCLGDRQLFNLGTNTDEALLKGLKAMDNAGNVEELYRIGRIAASKQINADHFPKGFDLPA